MLRGLPIFIAVVFSFFGSMALAQPNRDVWTIPGKVYLGEGFREWKVDASFDGRNSFSQGSTVRVGGVRLGIEYLRVNRFGIGFYDLSAEVRQESYTSPDTSFSPASLTLSYRSFYFERVLLLDRKWELSATAHLAAGDVIVNTTNRFTGLFEEYERLDVNPVELSASAYHHLAWWLSAGLGVGHRWMLNTPEEIVPLYNSTVFIAKVKIRVGKAVRSIWDKDARNEY